MTCQGAPALWNGYRTLAACPVHPAHSMPEDEATRLRPTPGHANSRRARSHWWFARPQPDESFGDISMPRCSCLRGDARDSVRRARSPARSLRPSGCPLMARLVRHDLDRPSPAPRHREKRERLGEFRPAADGQLPERNRRYRVRNGLPSLPTSHIVETTLIASAHTTNAMPSTTASSMRLTKPALYTA